MGVLKKFKLFGDRFSSPLVNCSLFFELRFRRNVSETKWRCQSQKRGQDLPPRFKMENFTTVTNDITPLTIVAEFSILDVYRDPGYAFEKIF